MTIEDARLNLEEEFIHSFNPSRDIYGYLLSQLKHNMKYEEMT